MLKCVLRYLINVYLWFMVYDYDHIRIGHEGQKKRDSDKDEAG